MNSMILGTGVDIIEVDRVAQRIENIAFRDKVFSTREQIYCDQHKHPEQHYAVRFAAKEAFLKALGTGLSGGYDLHQIEILSEENSPPWMELHGNFLTLFRERKGTKIHVSLSHLQTVACAMVILEQ